MNSSTKYNQKNIVLSHLQRNKKKGITSYDAAMLYGITDLRKRISDLRAEGYPIRTDFVTKKNRYGHNTTYGVYTLEQ